MTRASPGLRKVFCAMGIRDGHPVAKCLIAQSRRGFLAGRADIAMNKSPVPRAVAPICGAKENSRLMARGPLC